MSDSEDVRITERGQLQVTRRELLDHLRPCAGSFRVVDASPYWIWLKRVDDDPDAVSPGPLLRMAGEISGKLTVMEVLSMLATASWNGALQIVGTDSHRTLHLHQGVLKFASSNVPSERLGEVLLARGALTHAQLAECVAQLDTKRRIGEIVVDAGIVDREQLFSHMHAQMQVIFNGALLVREGFYAFTEQSADALPPSVTVNLPIQHLLMEGVQRIDEMELFRERIPSSDLVPVMHDHARSMTLDESLLPVVDLIDGKRSIQDLSRELGWDEFLTTKSIYQLLQLGLARLGAARTMDRTAVLNAVAHFNAVMQDIFATVSKHGPLDNTRDNLNAWIQGSGYGGFLGEEVGPDGSISAEHVLNALEQVDPAHAVHGLHQALHEVVSFALFAATPTLPRDVELTLSREVNQRLRALSGQG